MQAYHTMQLLAALDVLSTTDIFVGSYSSNVGRLVALLRAANGFHPRTTYSVDQENWFAWRRLHEKYL